MKSLNRLDCMMLFHFLLCFPAYLILNEINLFSPYIYLSIKSFKQIEELYWRTKSYPSFVKNVKGVLWEWKTESLGHIVIIWATFSCSPDFHDTLLAPLIFVLIALPIHIQYLGHFQFIFLVEKSREKHAILEIIISVVFFPRSYKLQQWGRKG